MRVRTEAKRDSILEIASVVFVEMGYERASMAAIAERVGGSKATLYGYFPSKEQLFVAVVHEQGKRHLEPAFDELVRSTDDAETTLRRFGERYLGFITQPFAIAGYRMVIAESGHSGFGKRFHEAGPKKSYESIAAYLAAEMAAGRLRQADADAAADHLVGLLQSEVVPRLLLGLIDKVSRAQLKQVVARAVEVFLRAYAAEPEPKGAAARPRSRSSP